MTDPIADMLTRIRNAYLAKHKQVAIPYSKEKESIAHLLAGEGYITDVTVDTDTMPPMIHLKLRYINNMPAVTRLNKISKPGRRIYIKANNIRLPLSGQGHAIISTSKGVLLARDAKKQNIGGELICEIW